MNRHKQQTRRKKPKQKPNRKQHKPMQTKKSVISTTNHQPSTACREKHAAMKLPIRSTVIAAFGLLSTLIPIIQTAHAQDLKPFRFDLVPASDAIAGCTSMPNPAATVAVFPREDIRGVDTLNLHAEGLRPNTTF